MAHSRRIIMSVEDIAAQAEAASALRHQNAGGAPAITSENDFGKPQVSFVPSSANHVTDMADSSTRDQSESQSAPLPQHRSRALHHIQTVFSGYDQYLAPEIVRSLSNVDRVSDGQSDLVNDGAEKGDRGAAPQIANIWSRSTDNSDRGVSTRRESAKTERQYDGKSDSNHQNEDNPAEMEGGAGRMRRESKPQLNEQEWRSMAKFAKRQGLDLMKQVEEQKRLRLAQEQEPPDIAKNDMEEMKKILQEKRRSSNKYLIPTESERDSTPEGGSPRRAQYPHHHQHHHHHSVDSERDVSPDRRSRRDSANSEINDELKSMFKEDPSEPLDWIRVDADTDKRIVVSEDHTKSLLQAIRESNLAGLADNQGALHEDWVPVETLREAERRSSAAKEEVRQFEQLLSGAGSFEGGGGEEQLRAVLSKSKTMDRHFAHMKKFVEDRQSDLRKHYIVMSEKDAKTWRPGSSRAGISPEKAKKDLQQHENQKKRIMKVFSTYNELLRLVKVEHSKRVEAENKSQHLTSQIKRQTVALKRAEKLIKHNTLSPRIFNESHSFKGASTADRSSMVSASPTASGRQSPRSLSTQHPSLSTLSGLQTRINIAEDHDGDIKRLNSARINGMIPLKRINTTEKSNITASAQPSSSTTTSPKQQTISKQLTYDLALEQALSRDPTPDQVRLSTSDLLPQNHKKEFEQLEKALIEEGRSRGFADVDLYSKKKTVGREETCWEYRHVHFDFTKPQQPASPHHEGRRSYPSTDLDRRENLDLSSVSNVPISTRTASPSRSEGSVIEEKRVYPSVKYEDFNKDLALIAGTHVGDELSSRVQSVKDDHHQDESSARRMALARISGEGSESISDKLVEIVKNRIAEEKITSNAKQQEIENLQSKQTEAFRRLKSTESAAAARKDVDRGIYGADISNDITSACRSLERIQAGDEVKMAENRDDVAGDRCGDDVAEAVKDEIWADVAKEDIWSDVSEVESDDVAEAMSEHQAEREADVVASYQSAAQEVASPSRGEEPQSGHVNTTTKARPQRESSDLQRRLATVEASQAARLLRDQVKRRRRLLFFQTLLFAGTLMWSSPCRSAPPPT